MPRRIFAYLLGLALIAFGTPWTVAGHAYDRAADAEAGLHTHHGQGGSDHGDGNCDHVCHAAAHLVALTSARPALVKPTVERFRISEDLAAATLAQPPPLKPPRA
jgi:hypothetical protein